MDRLEELKQNYASVLVVIQQKGVQLAHMHVQDNKLYLQGAAPSEDIKNAVWSQLKAVNPGYDDIIMDLSVDMSLPQPAAATQTYTVKAGDTLSKIAKQFYGSATEYTRIFEANRDKLSNPDEIQAGQQLVIPIDTKSAG